MRLQDSRRTRTHAACVSRNISWICICEGVTSVEDGSSKNSVVLSLTAGKFRHKHSFGTLHIHHKTSTFEHQNQRYEAQTGGYRRFGSTYRSHLQGSSNSLSPWSLNWDSLGYSETSGTNHQSILRNISEVQRLHLDRVQSPNSRTKRNASIFLSYVHRYPKQDCLRGRLLGCRPLVLLTVCCTLCVRFRLHLAKNARPFRQKDQSVTAVDEIMSFTVIIVRKTYGVACVKMLSAQHQTQRYTH
jgi:hypothetical protein